MLLSPPSPYVSSIASRYHPLVALNPPYHRVLLSGVSRSPISYYSRWIPFHIRQPPVPPFCLLLPLRFFPFFSFFSFSFFSISTWLFVHVLPAFYGHRCRWNIEISRTCISSLSPPVCYPVQDAQLEWQPSINDVSRKLLVLNLWPHIPRGKLELWFSMSAAANDGLYAAKCEDYLCFVIRSRRCPREIPANSSNQTRVEIWSRVPCS